MWPEPLQQNPRFRLEPPLTKITVFGKSPFNKSPFLARAPSTKSQFSARARAPSTKSPFSARAPSPTSPFLARDFSIKNRSPPEPLQQITGFGQSPFNIITVFSHSRLRPEPRKRKKNVSARSCFQQSLWFRQKSLPRNNRFRSGHLKTE